MHWETDAQKACAFYIASLSTSKQALVFCVVLQSTADYLVSLMIVSNVEEIKEKLKCMPTPQFVRSKPQCAALIH